MMKISELLPILKQAPYFTKQNLSLSLRKEGEGLNYWIKKLIAEGLLIPLKKGFYISQPYKDLISGDLANFEGYYEYLANILRSPSYVSLEYVLFLYNFIPEGVFSLTSITIKTPRIYASKLTSFIYKNIKEQLFFGWQIKDFKDKKVKIATLPKAIFDFFYLKTLPLPLWRDYLLESGRFNWDILSKKDKKEFLRIVTISSSEKMRGICEILRKGKIL